MRSFFVLFIIAYLFRPFSPVHAAGMGKASFTAHTSAGFDVKGEGASVSKDGNKYKIKLSDLKTGMGLRDEHMCKALECDKFPEALFEADPVAGNKVSGKMTLHGVTKPWEGELSKDGNTISVKGKLKLSDYGIKTPDYKLIHVEDSVEILIGEISS